MERDWLAWCQDTVRVWCRVMCLLKRNGCLMMELSFLLISSADQMVVTVRIRRTIYLYWGGILFALSDLTIDNVTLVVLKGVSLESDKNFFNMFLLFLSHANGLADKL